ncbi:NHLP family bacteriocin export ABC transporter peptidase/permease/ATPase subunit [Butyrivibrio proteoclasticus]|uniref:NHLP family bacteriocin export ABC transporter peptidase/permease/ATPase subunit n=1 Tax=Butyrivibrio proteoclasticus TaxID=43305 RepID=UPI000686C71C|nr:NHLP family bacteriocin export ABC transporter peptidase/permease/ATPase subunit [Butyrivibrio proteoclasticus]
MGANRTVKKPSVGKRVHVPIVMQMEALECGAACLDMILAYYGKWIPLEKVRYDCGVSRDGSNAKNILCAARNYGLEASGYRFEPETLVRSGSFPCIIHWEFNHFVVLCGFQGGYAYINDPGRGILKMSMSEFDEGFTGIVLCFEPGDNFVQSGKKMRTIDYVKIRLKGASKAVIFVLFSTFVAYLFNTLNPAFSRFFMDRLLSGENKELLMPFIVLFSAVAFFNIVSSAVSDIYSLRIDGKLSVLSNSNYVWKVLHLPMNFFSQRLSGDILQRKGSQISKILVDTVAPLLLNFVMMIFYLVFMLRYSPLLSLIGIASIVLNSFVGRLISRKRVNITRCSLRDSAKLESTTLSGVMMIETIKSSGAEAGFFKKWAGYQAAVNKEKIEYGHINIWLGSIPALINSLAGYMVLILGVALVMRDQFTLGMVLSFQMYLSYFTAPAMGIIGAGQSIEEMRSMMERYEDVMQYPDDELFDAESISDDQEYQKLKGDIHLRNVTFGYSRLANPVIKDFSLDIAEGSKVAIIGASGCGKSTLSKLISGLYKPWSGEITFSDKTIEQIDRNVFTGSVAVVDQDITLFQDTIDQNIKLWDNSIEDFEVILAARDAGIHDEIMERDAGYKGAVAENGNNFSGGQKQRLEIARVLAQDPSIIILDEATSALDAVTEMKVIEAIKKRGITCIVIAHRLSTIRDCDNIVVLRDGEIAEQGTHEELLEKGTYYKELVTNE